MLAPYGRFIEIGKRDIDENSPLPMRPFNQNLTFTAIDLDRMLKDRRDVMDHILHDVCGKLANNSLARLLLNTSSTREGIIQATNSPPHITGLLENSRPGFFHQVPDIFIAHRPLSKRAFLDRAQKPGFELGQIGAV